MTMPTTVIRPAPTGPAGAPRSVAGPSPAAESARAGLPGPGTVSAPAGNLAVPGSIAGRSDQPNPVQTLLALWPAGTQRGWLREGALAAVLVLTAVRAYDGVIRFDWPFLRGGDQFSHAVMAEQMLTHGSYGSYLIYPPGFPALTAVIGRLGGLTPLELFPVLAPALLVLCALGAYTLASGLWGWQYGITAAALNGLVLTGAYAGFAEGRYPDLVAVVAASAVLYHSVATLYAAVMLALVAAIALPYLLLQHQRRVARVLLLT